MVGNTDNTLHEYPHPSDADARYNTADERSGLHFCFAAPTRSQTAAQCNGVRPVSSRASASTSNRSNAFIVPSSPCVAA